MTLSPQQRALRAVTEKDWQQQVVEILQWHGWVVYHTWSSLHSEAGFPDVFAIHPRSGDRLAAELKRETGKVSPAQLRWLALIEMAGIDNFVWRPSDVDAVIERAKGHETSEDAAEVPL